MQTKMQIRKEILSKRDALSNEERIIKSRRITDAVLKLDCYQKAASILLFASYKSEVNTFLLAKESIHQGKTVFFPKVTGKEMEFYKIAAIDELKPGYHGILEPSISEANAYYGSVTSDTVMIMPGSVFDLYGNRIGYGGGFYDRYLEKLEKANYIIDTIAVGFECQIIENDILPADVHDKKTDYIVTEKRIISINETRRTLC